MVAETPHERNDSAFGCGVVQELGVAYGGVDRCIKVDGRERTLFESWDGVLHDEEEGMDVGVEGLEPLLRGQLRDVRHGVLVAVIQDTRKLRYISVYVLFIIMKKKTNASCLHGVQFVVVGLEVHGDELAALHLVAQIECHGRDLALSTRLLMNGTFDHLQFICLLLSRMDGQISALES